MGASRSQVLLFLFLAKKCISRRFTFIPRNKNMATLAMLGISIQDAKQRVLALTPSDYVGGPEPNLVRPNEEVWIFGVAVESVDLYVKLSVIVEPEECVCISFHEADRPMSFPFRDSGA